MFIFFKPKPSKYHAVIKIPMIRSNICWLTSQILHFSHKSSSSLYPMKSTHEYPNDFSSLFTQALSIYYMLYHVFYTLPRFPAQQQPTSLRRSVHSKRLRSGDRPNPVPANGEFNCPVKEREVESIPDL